MRRILVVGRNSFLAGAVLSALAEEPVRAVGHDAIDAPDLLDGIDVVVNFARHPEISRRPIAPDEDPDLRLARRLAGRDVAYVMASTRKVYAPSDRPLAEDAAPGPTDSYGRNKLATETALRDMLGERLTVLRIANVFGDELLPGRRSFFGIMLDRLAREGRIVLDVSPFVARDFLPVDVCARMMRALLADPPGGVLNVGSGIAMPLGRVALAVIEGFERGELLVTSPAERDAFVLDVTRLQARTGISVDRGQILSACRDIGRRLARSVQA